MKKVRKRKAVERMRIRSHAKDKAHPQAASVSAALVESFYKAPFSVDHIRLNDDFSVHELPVPLSQTTPKNADVSRLKSERLRLSLRRNAKIKWANRDHTGWWVFEEVEQWVSKRQTKSPASHCLVRLNLRLVQARSRDEAYRKAMKFGQAGMPSKTHGGEWRFAGISMLLPIYDKFEDGSEILWEEDKWMSVAKLKSLVKSKHQLPVFDDSDNNG
jgi:hypothetical protein